MVLGPAAPSSEILLKTQALGPPRRLQSQKLWGWGLATCVYHVLWVMLMQLRFEDHSSETSQGSPSGCHFMAGLITHLAVISDLQKCSSYILEHSELS